MTCASWKVAPLVAEKFAWVLPADLKTRRVVEEPCSRGVGGKVDRLALPGVRSVDRYGRDVRSVYGVVSKRNAVRACNRRLHPELKPSALTAVDERVVGSLDLVVQETDLARGDRRVHGGDRVQETKLRCEAGLRHGRNVCGPCDVADHCSDFRVLPAICGVGVVRYGGEARTALPEVEISTYNHIIIAI